MASGLRRFKKKNLASAAGLAEYLARPQPSGIPPAGLQRTHHVTSRQVQGFEVYSVTPRAGGPLGPVGSGSAVLYLHGGAYVAQITGQHWDFIGRLADRLGCRIDVPLYGLAPAHTYREAFPLVRAVYDDLVEAGATRIVLAGDSAGAGIALALAHLLADRPAPRPGNLPADRPLPGPGHLLLLSPWLDLTLANPAIDRVEDLDPWLSRAGLVEAGRAWAGGDDPTIGLLSPINTRPSGLAPLSIVIGTHDLMVEDCRRFRDRAQAAGVTVNYLEYPGMFHTWMLTRVPEGLHAFEAIVSVLHR